MGKKNVVLSISDEHDRIADIISLEFDAFKLKVATAGWGFLKYPVHMLKGILDRDVVMVPAKNLKEFHTVYVGGPLWMGKPCPALVDLIRKGAVKGKDVVVFVTGKGERSSVERQVASLVRKKGAFLKGLVMLDLMDDDKSIAEMLDVH